MLIKFENAANKQTNVASKLKALFLTFLLQIVHQVICFSYILEMTSSDQKVKCISAFGGFQFCFSAFGDPKSITEAAVVNRQPSQ